MNTEPTKEDLDHIPEFIEVLRKVAPLCDAQMVAELRNRVLEEAAEALDAEAELSPFAGTYEAAASLVRSLKSGGSE